MSHISSTGQSAFGQPVAISPVSSVVNVVQTSRGMTISVVSQPICYMPSWTVVSPAPLIKGFSGYTITHTSLPCYFTPAALYPQPVQNSSHHGVNPGGHQQLQQSVNRQTASVERSEQGQNLQGTQESFRQNEEALQLQQAIDNSLVTASQERLERVQDLQQEESNIRQAVSSSLHTQNEQNSKPDVKGNQTESGGVKDGFVSFSPGSGSELLEHSTGQSGRFDEAPADVQFSDKVSVDSSATTMENIGFSDDSRSALSDNIEHDYDMPPDDASLVSDVGSYQYEIPIQPTIADLSDFDDHFYESIDTEDTVLSVESVDTKASELTHSYESGLQPAFLARTNHPDKFADRADTGHKSGPAQKSPKSETGPLQWLSRTFLDKKWLNPFARKTLNGYFDSHQQLANSIRNLQIQVAETEHGLKQSRNEIKTIHMELRNAPPVASLDRLQVATHKRRTSRMLKLLKQKKAFAKKQQRIINGCEKMVTGSRKKMINLNHEMKNWCRLKYGEDRQLWPSQALTICRQADSLLT